MKKFFSFKTKTTDIEFFDNQLKKLNSMKISSLPVHHKTKLDEKKQHLETLIALLKQLEEDNFKIRETKEYAEIIINDAKRKAKEIIKEAEKQVRQEAKKTKEEIINEAKKEFFNKKGREIEKEFILSKSFKSKSKIERNSQIPVKFELVYILPNNKDFQLLVLLFIFSKIIKKQKETILFYINEPTLLKDKLFKLFKTLSEEQQNIIIDFIIYMQKKLDNREKLIEEIITKIQKFNFSLIFNIILYIHKINNDYLQQIEQKSNHKLVFKDSSEYQYKYFNEFYLKINQMEKDDLCREIENLLKNEKIDIKDFYFKFILLKELLHINFKEGFNTITYSIYDLFKIVFMDLDAFFAADPYWSIIKYNLFIGINCLKKLQDIFEAIYPFQQELDTFQDDENIKNYIFYVNAYYNYININYLKSEPNSFFIYKCFILFLDNFFINFLKYKKDIELDEECEINIRTILTIINEIIKDTNYNKSKYETEFSKLTELKYSLNSYYYYALTVFLSQDLNIENQNYFIKLFIDKIRKLDKLTTIQEINNETFFRLLTEKLGKLESNKIKLESGRTRRRLTDKSLELKANFEEETRTIFDYTTELQYRRFKINNLYFIAFIERIFSNNEELRNAILDYIKAIYKNKERNEAANIVKEILQKFFFNQRLRHSRKIDVKLTENDEIIVIETII